MLKRRMIRLLEKLLIQMDEIHKNYGAVLQYTQDYQKRLSIIRKVLVQEKEMFEGRKVSDRIVSVDRHYVRPIVRGKETKSVEFGAGRSGNDSGFFGGIDDQKAPRLRVAGGRGELCCLDAANQLFFGWTLLRVVVAAAFTLFDQLEKIRHKKAPFKLFYAVWQKKIVDTAGKQLYFRRKKQRCQAKKEKGESGENCTKREVLFLLSSAS